MLAMGWHSVPICLACMALALLLAVTPSTSSPTCSQLKATNHLSPPPRLCRFSYHRSVSKCEVTAGSTTPPATPTLEVAAQPRPLVREEREYEASSVIEVSIFLLPGPALVTVAGTTSLGKERCVRTHVGEGEGGWLTVGALPLPHGRYTVTVVQSAPPHTDAGPRQQYQFIVPDRRVRRDNGVDSSVFREILKQGEHSEPCLGCYNVTHQYLDHYIPPSLVVTLNRTDNPTSPLGTIKGVDTCDSQCAVLRLQLLRRRQAHSRGECLNPREQLEDFSSFDDINRTATPYIRQKYSDVSTGCYLLQIQNLHYAEFVWLESSSSVSVMAWNASFIILSDSEKKTVRVSWVLDNPDYNFTSYDVTLWHATEPPLNCSGLNTEQKVDIIQARINTTGHTFENLEPGLYCARVLPHSLRCEEMMGCPLLHTGNDRHPYIKLSAPEVYEKPGYEGWTTGQIAGVAAGAVGGALLMGLLALLLVRRYTRPSSGPVHDPSSNPLLKKERVLVLMVWTKDGPHGQYFVPIMAAFRDILASYVNCEVYDYLAMSQLPQEERDSLIASPTAWANSLLNRPDLKVVLVATEGARQRQQEQHDPVRDASRDCLDATLFPYLLRRLHEDPELRANYAKVFHVRFSEVSDRNTELSGIVSWRRYRLPEHLDLLKDDLHLCSASSSPPSEAVSRLHSALADHPLYRAAADLTHSPLKNGHCASNPIKESPAVENGAPPPHTPP